MLVRTNKLAMGNREKIEKGLVECWLAHDQSVAIEDQRDEKEYRHDIVYLAACLLNTYLDTDNKVDWRGTWADRLLDAELVSGSSSVWRATGLMACGKLSDGYMHLTPFHGDFVCSTELNSLQSYELSFAAEGPWDRAGTSVVVPYTKDEIIRHELLRDAMKPGFHWPTVYRSS